MDAPDTIGTPVTVEDAVRRMRDEFSDAVVNDLYQRDQNDFLDRCNELRAMARLIFQTSDSLTPDAVHLLERARVEEAHASLGSFWKDHVDPGLPVPGVFAEVEALIAGWSEKAMDDYTGIYQMARQLDCVVVVFNVEDVGDVLRRNGKEWTREKMWRFLDAQRDTLSELVADKGLETLERELAAWEKDNDDDVS